MEAAGLAVEALAMHHERTEIVTRERTQFVDLTPWVRGCVQRSGIDRGIVLVRALHTTATIVVNENEPLLLLDLREMLERLAPENGTYAHDDFARRGAGVEPDERRNGHSHARALLLGAAGPVEVTEGALDLGRWQSILLVELDGPRPRSISVVVMGHRRDRFKAGPVPR